jgi:hypothetical protein
LTLSDLAVSHLVTGEGNPSTTWDFVWRHTLVENLSVLVRELWAVGIEDVFINGSFVEDKDHPNDIDGYFRCARERIGTRELHVTLNARDPYQIWDWGLENRRPHPDSIKMELPMWHRYRVELYPEYGNSSGIRDPQGNDQPFSAAFRRSRHTGEPKGIVQIVR